MASQVVHINRYPNRRFYSRTTSEYVSLERIEQFVRDGRTVEIRDSQTQEDITRIVLAQLLIERQPEKIALFPTSLLHQMLRANDLMADMLRTYFRDSLTYLEYLQQHGATGKLSQPIHWLQAWLEGVARRTGLGPVPTLSPEESASAAGEEAAGEEANGLSDRLAELETRLRKLEQAD